MCTLCEERPARFRYRGKVKADRDHTLCFQCYRDLKNSLRHERREPRDVQGYVGGSDYDY